MIEYIPVTRPTNLVGVPNGQLPFTLLKPVYFPGVGHLSLHPQAARAWNAMAVVCFAETGQKLSTTGTYRSYDQQVQLFNQRMSPIYNPITCTTTTRFWNKKRYWLKRGFAPCATPATSTHGWALAVDTAIAGPSKVLGITTNLSVWRWLSRNAVSFGWSWEGVKVPGNWEPGQVAPAGFEPWHIRYVAGDTTPQRVLDVEAFFAGVKP
jgi:LAS superfamily LD-carboxypeptidase LdcB